MSAQTTEFNQLLSALPNRFQFYHLGEVQLQPLDFDIEDTHAIAFRLYGDLRALIIIQFAKDLDPSVYSELGNILASKIATQLHQENELDALISPPQQISRVQLDQFTQNNPNMIRRTYAHLFKNTVIPIAAWILPTPSEGIGYA